MKLDPTQQLAVEAAHASQVSIITGGPGVGKTTVCRQLLDSLDLPAHHIALCAPTGKAARRLEEQTDRAASTVHRLLGWNPIAEGFEHDASNPLPHRFVVIDEASMLDVELAAALLSAVQDDARIVFVGDVDQLPSVGPGNVLHDLIESKVVPTTRLETIHRQAADSAIPWVARAVRDGEMPEIDGAPDVDFIGRDTVTDVAETIEDLARAWTDDEPPQILSPQRTTAAGVTALNERLQEALNPARQGVREIKAGGQVIREGDRVMHVRNNYTLGVMNGEIGEVISIVEGDVGVDFGDRIVAYETAGQRGELRLCYATTIHKSQGSEYGCVVVVVHSAHSFMLSRSLLYTAITRGKERVVLVGNRKGLRRAVKNGSVKERWTGLQRRMAG